MELSGQQRRQLRDALISAFPTYSLLEQLLDFELDKKLNQITQDSNLQSVVYQLIQRAQAEGWLVELVRAARKENPGNSQLEAIADELLVTDASSDVAIRDKAQITSFPAETPESRRQQPTPSDDLPSDRGGDLLFNQAEQREDVKLRPQPASSDDLSSDRNIDEIPPEIVQSQQIDDNCSARNSEIAAKLNCNQNYEQAPASSVTSETTQEAQFTRSSASVSRRYALSSTNRDYVIWPIIPFICSFLVPPVGVFLLVGFGIHFWLNILLTLLGWLPGLLHAVWLISNRRYSHLELNSQTRFSMIIFIILITLIIVIYLTRR